MTVTSLKKQTFQPDPTTEGFPLGLLPWPFVRAAVPLVYVEVWLNPGTSSQTPRFGFGTPKNYTDNQGFCGGFSKQWGVNGGRLSGLLTGPVCSLGKCGLCGDAWDASVEEHEAPGGRQG